MYIYMYVVIERCIRKAKQHNTRHVTSIEKLAALAGVKPNLICTYIYLNFLAMK